MADAVIPLYGIADANYHLLRHAGNTLFRIRTSSLPSPDCARDLFSENDFLLRIHEPSYQEPVAIELELAWLAAMRAQDDLPVPEPIPDRDGRLLASVEVPGIPGRRYCSLLRWIKGHPVHHRLRPHHLKAQGRLLARLHDFSSGWQLPAGPVSKRSFDWDGLFKNNVGSGMTNEEAWTLLPRSTGRPSRGLRRGSGS